MTPERETPPGTATLVRLRTAISYRFVETPNGGRVDIGSSDRDAVDGVHAFLRCRIAEHHTR